MFPYLISISHELEDFSYVIDNFTVIPDDALQLKEPLQCLHVQAQLLVGEAEVVESLQPPHTGPILASYTK